MVGDDPRLPYCGGIQEGCHCGFDVSMVEEAGGGSVVSCLGRWHRCKMAEGLKGLGQTF